VAVPDLEDESAYRPALERLGLVLRLRERSRRFFRPPATAARTVHVHACQQASAWERDHLAFRDYLRAHPAVTARYAPLKTHPPRTPLGRPPLPQRRLPAGNPRPRRHVTGLQRRNRVEVERRGERLVGAVLVLHAGGGELEPHRLAGAGPCSVVLPAPRVGEP